jgi:hypothetical protein
METFAFVHIMKTAGQTVRAILRKNFGPRHCDFLVNEEARADDWKWARKCYPRLESIGGHSVMPRGEFDRIFSGARYFTFLRDPIKRCLSHYQFLIDCGCSIDDFANWIPSHANYQCKILCGEEHAEHAIEILESKVKLVGLVERFDESLLLWKRWVGDPKIDVTYRSVNVAKSNRIKQQLLSVPRNRELLEECHNEDLKLHRHVVEEIYPRQQREYGEALADDLRSFQESLATATNWSWNSLLGQAKRNLIFRPGVRDWEADLQSKAA